MRIVYFLIILNFAVYAAWLILGHNGVESYFMTQNFLVSWQALLEGRFWTLVTSAFSHNLFWHFLMNIFVLRSFGPVLARVLGAFRFLKFYILAAIISSLSHALVSAFILGDPGLPALGASGAISGLILLFSMIFPKERIYLFGILPLPAIVGALLFIGLDIWGLVSQAEGGGLPIGHGSHLGGAFTGIFYYFFIIRPKLMRTGSV